MQRVKTDTITVAYIRSTLCRNLKIWLLDTSSGPHLYFVGTVRTVTVDSLILVMYISLIDT